MMNNGCWGDRSTVTIDLTGGVRMRVHCQGSAGHHLKGNHYATLRINESHIDFEWPEVTPHDGGA